jgi:hypothetical protein
MFENMAIDIIDFTVFPFSMMETGEEAGYCAASTLPSDDIKLERYVNLAREGI